jgi:hypothetical protein
MTVYTLDPLKDGRWPTFLERHPRASIFHMPGWLEALRRTYNYQPVVYTTTPPGADLTNGMVVCRVNSWMTGRRLVSLPFSDHCEPLVAGSAECSELLHYLREIVDKERLRSIEIRLATLDSWPDDRFATSQTFAFHKLDLRPSVTDLFSGLHKDGIQRKIRRAEREGITQEEGRSDHLLRIFYTLLILTRRRHGVPPPPISWFRHIRDGLMDRLTVRVAFKDGHPIAAILTLCHKDTLFFKYGGSDARHHNSGAVPFLFWNAIQSGKRAGLLALDLGRSDRENQGLITFKDRLGATSSVLTYSRYPPQLQSSHRSALRLVRALVRVLPDAVLVTAGKLLYRHIA